ncbi:hypothetical protein [Chryseobacterium gambrini]|uniref:Lipoprotein n=1 Tax=Chryseobacterium gambrini TaxID=373672 RepID=A0ABM8K6N4_9FLAO|nr:hypothetical protein CRDW_20220 [Chryseobacterium gambrini]
MIKNLILLFVLISLVSCSNKSQEKPNFTKYSFENILSYNNEDTIFIKSKFSDCGEWGGHEELIKIYRSEDRNPKLSYTKFKVDCGVRDSRGSIIQTKMLTKDIFLSNSQQLVLMKYMNDLMKSKFLNKEISNSGNSFYLSNTKEDLKISHHGNQQILLESYNNLMTSLKLPKVNIDNR